MTIDDLRLQIDELDAELLDILKQRLETAKLIAALKQAEGTDVFVPEREAQVLKDRVGQAVLMGLSDPFIRKLFEDIMAESRRLQQEVIDTPDE